MRILLSATGGSTVTNAIKSVSSSLSGAGGLGGALLGIGAAAAGLAIGVGVTAVKAAGDFQSSLTTLVTGAGELQGNLAMVSNGILKLAVDTGTSTKQLIDGLYMIESAGYHGAAGLNVLKIAAQGARVGNADLGTVANTLTTILTDYHLKASQATGAMNALTTTVASGKVKLQDLASAMGTVLPLASSLHVSFPQVAGAMATMTNAGVPAQRASMDLANALRALSSPSGIAVKAMASVGLTSQQLSNSLSTKGLAATLQLIEDHVGKKFPAGSVQAANAFKDILGGATGYNTALILGGKNMAAYQGNIDAITKSMHLSGDAVKGWSNVQSDFNFKISQVQEMLGTFSIKLGTLLLPSVGKVVDAFSKTAMPALTGFGDFLTSHGPQFAKIGANIGQFFAAFKAPGLGVLTKQLGSDFVGAVQKALNFLSSPAFGQFMRIVGTDLGNAVNKSIPVIEHLSLVAMKFVQDIVTRVQPSVQKFMDWWSKAWPGISILLSGVWDSIKGVIKIAWALVSGIIKVGLDVLTGNWKKVWGDIKDALHGVWDGLKNIVQGGLKEVQGFLETFFPKIRDAITAPFQAAYKTISGFFDSIGRLISGASTSASNVRVPGHAAGILNSPIGHMAMVGERGPELMFVPRGSSIFPSGLLSSSGISGGTGHTNVFNISISTMARSQSEVNRLVDMFEQELSRRFRTETPGYASGNIF